MEPSTLDLASLPQVWGLLLGILLPGLTSVVQQPHWSKSRRVFIAVVASIVLGTGTAFCSGQLDLTNWVTTVGVVLVSAQTAYESLWQPTGVAAAIEYQTSGYTDTEVDFLTDVDDYDDPAEWAPAACANGTCGSPTVHTWHFPPTDPPENPDKV